MGFYSTGSTVGAAKPITTESEHLLNPMVFYIHSDRRVPAPHCFELSYQPLIELEFHKKKTNLLYVTRRR